MRCGSCQFTDGKCYISLPPKVKCTIMNEFRLYEDECSCPSARATHESEEVARLKDLLLNEPGPLMTIKYDDWTAPSVTITREDADAAYSSLLQLPAYGQARAIAAAVDESQGTDVDAWKVEASVEYGCMPCLVCGAGVGIYSPRDDRPKICPTCRKAIRFIKERFKVELEAYTEGDD